MFFSSPKQLWRPNLYQIFLLSNILLKVGIATKLSTWLKPKPKTNRKCTEKMKLRAKKLHKSADFVVSVWVWCSELIISVRTARVKHYTSFIPFEHINRTTSLCFCVLTSCLDSLSCWHVQVQVSLLHPERSSLKAPPVSAGSLFYECFVDACRYFATVHSRKHHVASKPFFLVVH